MRSGGRAGIECRGSVWAIAGSSCRAWRPCSKCFRPEPEGQGDVSFAGEGRVRLDNRLRPEWADVFGSGAASLWPPFMHLAPVIDM